MGQRNKKLKKIVNVYKLNYLNGKSPGLGDYLRGCFCLRQLSQLLNIEFDLDISQHPLSKYIENPLKVENIDYDNVNMYHGLNIIDGKNKYEDINPNINTDFLIKIINYLNNQNCETFGLFSNAFTLFNKYSENGIKFIRSRLRPNKHMSDYVDVTLNDLNLFKKSYDIIHIRSGDKYLVNGESMNSYILNKLKNIISQCIVPDKKYLIISDCNILKAYLKSKLSNIYIYIKQIEHLGGESLKSIKTDGIMNTMLDFFLMEHSNSILSLSVYDHVSGFSKYSSIINSIPIKFIKIDL